MTNQVRIHKIGLDGTTSAYGDSAAESVMVSQLAEAFRDACWRVALYYGDEGER